MREKLWKKYHEAKENKKGFTLVELIVVLVIIGILAAILLPSLLRYIDSAKDKQLLANARTVYTAVTSAASEEYGKQAPALETTGHADTKITDLLKSEGFSTSATVNWIVLVTADYKVSKVYYEDTKADRAAYLDSTTTGGGDGWETDTIAKLATKKSGVTATVGQYTVTKTGATEQPVIAVGK